MCSDPDRPRRSLPSKCTSCARQLDSPFFCNACKRLYPADGLNYFELFELQAHYKLDSSELRRRYFELSRTIHPDATADSGDAVHRLSLRVSARLNQAFRVLSDPVLRAEYLLELYGGPSAADDKQVAPEILNETLMLREEIEDAAEDSAARVALAARIDDRCTALEAEIADLAAALPGDADRRATLRQKLNARKYFEKMRERLATLE